MIYLYCEVVGFYYVNIRLTVLEDESRGIRDLKLKDF